MAIYVAAVPWLGIYLASFLLIAGLHALDRALRLGSLTLAVSLGLQVVTYVTFERWFLVPLPKGPIEDLLGL